MSLSVFNIACIIFMGNTSIQSNILALDTTINFTLNVAIVLVLISLSLLMVFKVLYEENPLTDVVEFFKNLVPKDLKMKIEKTRLFK